MSLLDKHGVNLHHHAAHSKVGMKFACAVFINTPEWCSGDQIKIFDNKNTGVKIDVG